MKIMARVGVLIAALFVAACGGKGNATDPQPNPPTTAAKPEPKLHLAMLDASNMRIRSADGAPDSAYLMITFTNISGGKVVGSPLSLPQPQPAYPLDIPYQPGYNHVDIKYLEPATSEDSTDYVKQGAAPKSTMPSFAAYSTSAVVPNLIPMAGLNSVALVSPTTGDYAPWVYVAGEKADGTVFEKTYYKPTLPFKIPTTDYVRVTVSTGSSAADGSYVPGASKAWEIGSSTPKATITLPTSVIRLDPIAPSTPSNPDPPPINPPPVDPPVIANPTVVSIDTVTKRVTISPAVENGKIINLQGGNGEAVLDSTGKVIAGYTIDWMDVGTQYNNVLQLPTTAFALAAHALGTGSARPCLIRPDKSQVFFDTSKCKVTVNGVEVPKTSSASAPIAY